MNKQPYGLLDLSGQWKLRGSDGQRGAFKTHHLTETDDVKWMDADVPGEVHLELIKRGLIGEPTEGLHALSGRWVEEFLWSYRTTFTAADDAIVSHAWLIFEGLDYHAKIYLNEELVGEHANFFRPCRIQVTGRLRKENLLVVVLDSGLYWAGNKFVEGYYENSGDHALHKRIWLRKPQSSFGWDWSARYVNVGIHKPVYLEWSESAKVDGIVVLADVNDRQDEGTVTVRAFVEGCGESPCEAVLSVRFSGEANSKSFEPHERIVEADTKSPAVDISLMSQEDRWILHLTQYSAKRHTGNTVMEEMPVRRNIGVRLRPPQKPRKLYLAPSGEELEWSWQDGAAVTTIPELHIHKMIVLEF